MTDRRLNALAYLGLAAFIFVLYLPAVSPMIGAGPSAILTAAVTAGGLAPSPNYPIHGIFSKVFMSLPGMNPDYALNVMSFVFAALSVLLLTRLTNILCGLKGARWTALTGTSLAWLFFAAPGLARLSFFAERYTVDLFFVLVSVSITASGLKAPARLQACLVQMAFLCSFIFFCHGKSVPLVLAMTVLLIFWSYRVRQLRPWKLMAIAFALGLLPILYLPLISSHDPLFDWSNPENLRNLWLSLTRKEYMGLPIARTWEEAMTDWGRQYRVLYQQTPWYAFALSAAGLFFLSRRNWKMIPAVVGLHLLTGELITLMQHFRGGEGDPFVQQMYDWQMTGYYAPNFCLWLALAAAGVTMIANAISRRQLVIWIFVLINVAGSWRQKDKNSAREYSTSLEIARNLEAVIPRGAVLFTNFDTLFADLSYHQLQSNLLADRPVLHMELMFRSWYYSDIERLYPTFWEKHKVRLEALKNLILDFENAGFDPTKFEYRIYSENLNGLAADSMNDGAFAYVDPTIQPLRPGIFRPFKWESEGIAYRLVPGSHKINPLPVDQWSFEGLNRDNGIWAARIRDFYRLSLNERLKRAELLQSNEVPVIKSLLAKIR